MPPAWPKQVIPTPVWPRPEPIFRGRCRYRSRRCGRNPGQPPRPAAMLTQPRRPVGHRHRHTRANPNSPTQRSLRRGPIPRPGTRRPTPADRDSRANPRGRPTFTRWETVGLRPTTIAPRRSITIASRRITRGRASTRMRPSRITAPVGTSPTTPAADLLVVEHDPLAAGNHGRSVVADSGRPAAEAGAASVEAAGVAMAVAEAAVGAVTGNGERRDHPRRSRIQSVALAMELAARMPRHDTPA